jgi:NTP pyrophosphatase (non-canonical NTP hydrolase)
MNGAINEQTLAMLTLRIAKSNKRYGDFASTHEALGVCSEEFDELKLAIHANDLDQIAHEALDLAAACIRLAQSLENESTRARSIK